MWKSVKLGDVCLIQSGNSIAAKKKTELFTNVVGTPYVATKDIGFDGNIDYENGIYIPQKLISSFKISPSGSTLVCAEGGSAGRKIAFSTNDCCYVNKLFSITPNESLEAKYIYYYALSLEFQSQFKAALHGLIGGVSLKKIKEFTITIPPLAEQQRIVAKLDTAFAEIDRTIEIVYEQIRNSSDVYSAILTLTLNQLKKDTKLSECCSFLNGYAFKSNEAVENTDVQLLRMGNLYNNVLDLERKPVFYPSEFAQHYSKYVLNSGDIVMTLTGTVGKQDYGYAIKVPVTEKKLLLNQRILKLHNFDSCRVNQDYLLYVLRSKSFLDELYSTSNGTRQANLSSETIKNLKIPLPDITTQNTLARRFQTLELTNTNYLDAMSKKANELMKLKSAFLVQELNPSEAA